MLLRFGVPMGEWNGLSWSLNRGAAIARLELVLASVGGPTAPKGDAARGAIDGTSFHGSLGEKVSVAGEIGPETTRGVGLKVAALALSSRGDVRGELGDVTASSVVLDEEVGPFAREAE